MKRIILLVGMLLVALYGTTVTLVGACKNIAEGLGREIAPALLAWGDKSCNTPHARKGAGR